MYAYVLTNNFIQLLVSAQRGAVAQQRPRELPPIPNIPQILQEDSPVTSIMNNRITEDIFDMKNIEKHPSFHRVSRGDGLCMLQHKRNGTFLIRPSSQVLLMIYNFFRTLTQDVDFFS